MRRFASVNWLAMSDGNVPPELRLLIRAAVESSSPNILPCPISVPAPLMAAVPRPDPPSTGVGGGESPRFAPLVCVGVKIASKYIRPLNSLIFSRVPSAGFSRATVGPATVNVAELSELPSRGEVLSEAFAAWLQLFPVNVTWTLPGDQLKFELVTLYLKR